MIYLVRHAESYINVSIGKVEKGENENSELTNIGKWQAHRLADYFSDKNIDKIITSPYFRTQQTARIIAENKNLKVITSNLIREVDYGELSNFANPMKYANEKIREAWSNKPQEAKFPNGESFNDIKKRTANFLDNIKNNEGNILVISHRDIIRMILSLIKNNNFKDYWKPEIETASVHLVVKNDKVFRIKELDLTEHLK